MSIPLYIAVGALALHGVGLILRFIAEYSIFWSRDPRLGNVICGAYDSEIHKLKSMYDAPKPSTVTNFVHERKTYEYVARAFARKYRFDAVFRADRFSTIFHYIMTGLEAGSHWAGNPSAFDYWGVSTAKTEIDEASMEPSVVDTSLDSSSGTARSHRAHKRVIHVQQKWLATMVKESESE